MKTLILAVSILVATVTTAQSFDSPLKLDPKSKYIPTAEWYTYDGETKWYRGSSGHVDETAWVVLYETEGDWHADDSVAVRTNDEYMEIEMDGGMKDVYIWFMYDNLTLMLILSDEDEMGMICVKPTEKP